MVDSIKQDTPSEASDANMVMGSVASDLASNGPVLCACCWKCLGLLVVGHGEGVGGEKGV